MNIHKQLIETINKEIYQKTARKHLIYYCHSYINTVKNRHKTHIDNTHAINPCIISVADSLEYYKKKITSYISEILFDTFADNVYKAYYSESLTTRLHYKLKCYKFIRKVGKLNE